MGHFIWDRTPNTIINSLPVFSAVNDLTGYMSKIGWVETFGPSIVNDLSAHNISRSQPLGPMPNEKPDPPARLLSWVSLIFWHIPVPPTVCPSPIFKVTCLWAIRSQPVILRGLATGRRRISCPG